MATRRKYRERYLKWHATYQKRATTELRKVFRKWIKDIPFDTVQAGTYSSVISNTMKIEDLFQSYVTIYHQIGKTHGRRVGKDINQGLKNFTWHGFLTIFEMNIGSYLRSFGFQRITTVRKAFFEELRELFDTRLQEGKDMRTVAKEVEAIVNKKDFYRWQAERIARTESTAASNYAAIQSGQVSGFQMGKEWISATDNRTRRKPDDNFDHFAMNGKQVKLNDSFVFNEGTLEEDRLEYPGDPNGRAGNVINCRCTVAVIPLRDKDGNLIPTR